MSSITTSGLKSVTLACALAIATTLSFSAAANAASYVPGDFSAAISPNVNGFWVDDCYVEVGMVFDWTPRPNYAHVGGVRVTCLSMHPVIEATVALFFWYGNRWVQFGDSNYGKRTNSYGSGNAILYTPRYCVGAYRTYSWAVGVTVRTERAGATSSSYHTNIGTRDGC